MNKNVSAGTWVAAALYRFRRTTVGEVISMILVLLLIMQTAPAPMSARQDQQLPAQQGFAQNYPPAVATSQEAATLSPAAATDTPAAIGGLSVSVGFADNAQPSPNFPVPWQGSPNILFLGNGSPTEAGAIRLDNTSGAPMSVTSVSLDLQRPGPAYNLWGSFVIPAQGSAILTQTAVGNFKTNGAPIVACGGTIPAGDPRVPKITVTVAGTAAAYLDSAHVLDTGGFDSSCRGGQSLEWRAIGTTGMERPAGSVVITSGSGSPAGGAPYSAVALVTDAAGQPLVNATVGFRVASGPGAGTSGQAVTDFTGNARFTYSSATPGVDVLQASVTNSTGGAIQANPVTVSWTSQSCTSTTPATGANTTNLIYLGAASGVYGQPLPLAALLTNGAGVPLTGRTVSFGFAGQTFPAATDATGVARVTVLPGTPGTIPLTASFAGDLSQPAAQISKTVSIDRAASLLRYTGKTLLGTAAPQQLTAKLTAGDQITPLAGRAVLFQVGTLTATANTDVNGVAAATMTLTADQASGPASLRLSFAGDTFYKPASQTVPVTVYLSTAFVIWGGNTAGLKLGQDVNFWGAQWPKQVIQGDFVNQGDFKGLADPVNQIHTCQVGANLQTLTSACWTSKPGQSWPPPLTVPAYIEVIVATVVVKKAGLIYGNIAAAAVVKVDPTPAYGPDPGKPGFGVLVAVIEDGANIFPPPAAPAVTQTQPAAVAPGQQITVAASVTNSSATAAANAVLGESFDGVTPSSANANLGTIAQNQTLSQTFPVSVPAIPARQGNEQAADYLTRLGTTNGRLFTSTATLTFSDANSQIYQPVTATSSSRLQIPILSVALTAPAIVAPGSLIPYQVTVTNLGSATATSATAALTLPGGSSSVLISNLAPGASYVTTVNSSTPAVPPIGPSETTDQYLARLQAADAQSLTASVNLTWQDAVGNLYGDVAQQVFTRSVRLPVLTLTPTTPFQLLPRQTGTLSFVVQNLGGCTAVGSSLKVTNPDITASTPAAFTLGPGQTTTLQTTWKVPGVPDRLSTETDAQYQGRLQSLNQAALNFLMALSWKDPGGATYGPTTTTRQSTEVLPIVTVAMSGPRRRKAGTAFRTRWR